MDFSLFGSKLLHLHDILFKKKTTKKQTEHIGCKMAACLSHTFHSAKMAAAAKKNTAETAKIPCCWHTWLPTV